MTELKQHPLSAAFPAMSADDFHVLVDDVKKNGQREPIMLFEGMVLDGWHRYRACIQVGVPVKKFNLAAEDDPVAFVLSHNLHRRHLTPSQRAAAVVACSEWLPKGKPGKPETVSGLREKDMAKAAGTSDRTIRDAKVAHKAGLGGAVKDGLMTAHEAATVVRGTPPAAKQPKPKRTLESKPADVADLTTDDDLKEAQDTIVQLSEQNDELRDKLAVESMDAGEEAKVEAAQTIADLRAQVKTLEAELSAMKSSRDGYMRENASMKTQLASQRRELDKLRKVAA